MPILATIGTGLGVAKGVSGLVSGIFGGGSDCNSNIESQRAELAQNIDKILTYSEKKDLVNGTESPVQPNGASMARFFFGGDDCKHKNVTSGDRRFLDRLPVVLQRKAQELQARQDSQKQKDLAGNNVPDSNVATGTVQAGFSNQTLILLALAAGGLLLVK